MSSHHSNLEDKLKRFNQLCDEHPKLVRESLLVFKTWIRSGNKLAIPYMESTLDECLEWFDSRVISE
jgi:hypothetical protein